MHAIFFTILLKKNELAWKVKRKSNRSHIESAFPVGQGGSPPSLQPCLECEKLRNPMSTPLSKDEKAEILSSLRRYFTENLDLDLSEMQAGFLQEYFIAEIAPIACNKGVEDAQKYLLRMTEDLPSTCFQEPMTYWKNRKIAAGAVQRKPQ